LENGDRLTRAEFERRYDAMPELRKAELIEGVVYLTSPVHVDQHGEPHADEDGITRSRVFPGLWLDARALLRGDLARVHDALADGLASPDHGVFAARNAAALAE